MNHKQRLIYSVALRTLGVSQSTETRASTVSEGFFGQVLRRRLLLRLWSYTEHKRDRVRTVTEEDCVRETWDIVMLPGPLWLWNRLYTSDQRSLCFCLWDLRKTKNMRVQASLEQTSMCLIKLV